jgi:hypothetical protein
MRNLSGDTARYARPTISWTTFAIHTFLCAKADQIAGMRDPVFVATDGRGRLELRNHPNRRYLMWENEDGSILLHPSRGAADAQREFDTNSELQNLLAWATASRTVRRARKGLA